jgi:hypothetical protein
MVHHRISRRAFGASLGAACLLARPARPKLAVLIVIEQFRSDYLNSAGPQLSPAGFRRLMEKGAFFPDCRHQASTFSASSLATLATGAWPAQHGIVADAWYDRAAQTVVQPSDEELLATTVTAQAASDPQIRAAVIGLDRTHASLFAGTPGARTFWMDDKGAFVSAGEPPEWLSTFNNYKAAEAARNAKWQALGAKPDAPALRTLTWTADRPAEFLSLYRASPYGQSAQFNLLSELIAREKMGQGATFDFVSVISQSTALLGYETGSRSPLMNQMVLHLDREIDQLLGQLSRTLGDNGFLLAVACAHGAPPEPAPESRARLAVPGETIAQAVQRTLIPGGAHVEKYLYPFLSLDPGTHDAESTRLAAARAAMAHPAVAGWFTAGGACSAHNDWERRFRNSFHPVRSGDVMLSYRPEYVEDYAQGRGVSYGSLYNYDVDTPLFLYGPPFRTGVFESPVESVDLAPTLARVFGVALPSSAVGRALDEALAE